MHITTTTTTFVVQRNRKLPTQQCFFFKPTYYQQLQLHNPCDMNAKQINWRQFTVKLSKNKTVSRSKLLRKWKKIFGRITRKTTPARTLSISGLKSRVLKLTFLTFGLDFFYFEIHRASSESLLPSAKKNCPERLNWPGRLAGISEGARGISK